MKQIFELICPHCGKSKDHGPPFRTSICAIFDPDREAWIWRCSNCKKAYEIEIEFVRKEKSDEQADH